MHRAIHLVPFALAVVASSASAQIAISNQTAPFAVAEDFESYSQGEISGILHVPGASLAEDCVGEVTTEQPSGFELTTGFPTNPPTLAVPPAQDGVYVTHSISQNNNTLAGLAMGLALDDIGEGAITIRYDTPHQQVGLRIWGGASGGHASFRCFSSTGAFIGQMTVASTPDRDVTITSSGAPIQVVTFTNDDPQGLAIDDLRHPLPVPISYCWGHGGGTPCPCGNSGSLGHGCRNSTYPEGAQLAGSGSNGLVVTKGAPNQFALFLRGTMPLNGGNGVPFGDGLRCVGGTVSRLLLTHMDGTGSATFATLPVPPMPGTHYYQVWYRDPNGSPCGTGFNLSNGLYIL